MSFEIILIVLIIVLIIFFIYKKNKKKSNKDIYPLWWFNNYIKTEFSFNMKILLRYIYDKFLKKNRILWEMVVRIYYYSGYPIYIFCKMTKKPYVGSYLFSDQEAGRERLKITKLILKKIKKKKNKYFRTWSFLRTKYFINFKRES